jgi:hypothetical protein
MAFDISVREEQRGGKSGRCQYSRPGAAFSSENPAEFLAFVLLGEKSGILPEVFR